MTSGDERHSLDNLFGQKTPFDEPAVDAVMKAQDAASRVMDKAVFNGMRADDGRSSNDELGTLSAPATPGVGEEPTTRQTKGSGVQR